MLIRQIISLIPLIVYLATFFASSTMGLHFSSSLFRGYPLAISHNLGAEGAEFGDLVRNVHNNGLTITFANVRLPRISLSHLRLPSLLARIPLPKITINVSL